MRHPGSRQLRLYSGDAQPPPPGLWLLHYEVTGPGRLSGRLAVEVDGTTCRPPADGLGLAAVARAFSLSPPAELDTGPGQSCGRRLALTAGLPLDACQSPRSSPCSVAHPTSTSQDPFSILNQRRLVDAAGDNQDELLFLSVGSGSQHVFDQGKRVSILYVRTTPLKAAANMYDRGSWTP